MVDALDEYLVQSLTEFDGNPLQSITKEGLQLGDEDKLEKLKEEMKPLTDWLQSVYGDRVEKVTVSNRIAQSPCVLVSGQYVYTLAASLGGAAFEGWAATTLVPPGTPEKAKKKTPAAAATEDE